jgi:hypothetical protein
MPRVYRLLNQRVEDKERIQEVNQPASASSYPSHFPRWACDYGQMMVVFVDSKTTRIEIEIERGESPTPMSQLGTNM